MNALPKAAWPTAGKKRLGQQRWLRGYVLQSGHDQLFGGTSVPTERGDDPAVAFRVVDLVCFISASSRSGDVMIV